MKKTKNLEDIGELLKEKKPKKEKKPTVEATSSQVARDSKLNIQGGLKIFR